MRGVRFCGCGLRSQLLSCAFGGLLGAASCASIGADASDVPGRHCRQCRASAALQTLFVTVVRPRRGSRRSRRRSERRWEDGVGIRATVACARVRLLRRTLAKLVGPRAHQATSADRHISRPTRSNREEVRLSRSHCPRPNCALSPPGVGRRPALDGRVPLPLLRRHLIDRRSQERISFHSLCDVRDPGLDHTHARTAPNIAR